MTKITAKNRSYPGKSQRKIGGPAANIKDPGTRNSVSQFDFPDTGSPPAAIKIRGEEVIQKVVPGRDGTEHVPHSARFIAFVGSVHVSSASQKFLDTYTRIGLQNERFFSWLLVPGF